MPYASSRVTFWKMSCGDPTGVIGLLGFTESAGEAAGLGALAVGGMATPAWVRIAAQEMYPTVTTRHAAVRIPNTSPRDTPTRGGSMRGRWLRGGSGSRVDAPAPRPSPAFDDPSRFRCLRLLMRRHVLPAEQDGCEQRTDHETDEEGADGTSDVPEGPE